MGLTISTGDPRAAFITGGGITNSYFSGFDADSTNGAQTIAAMFDREATPIFRIVRGTSGTTNLVVKNDQAEDCFITVASDQTTLTSSATAGGAPTCDSPACVAS